MRYLLRGKFSAQTLSTMQDIDAPGFRIIVPEKGVAEANLSQTLKNAKLIGVPTRSVLLTV